MNQILLLYCKRTGLIFFFCGLIQVACAGTPASKKNNLHKQKTESNSNSAKEKELAEAEIRWQQELIRRKILKENQTNQQEQQRKQKLAREQQAREEADLLKEKERQEQARKNKIEKVKQLEQQKEKREQQAKRKQELVIAEQEQQRLDEQNRRQQEADRLKAQAEAQQVEIRRLRKKQNTQKLARKKESGTFWFQDAQTLGQGRILLEGKGAGQVVLVRNSNPLLQHGASTKRKPYPAKFEKIQVIKPDQFELTQMVLGKQGNFLLYQFPSGIVNKNKYNLFTILLGGSRWTLINLYTDGDSLIHLDLEQKQNGRFRRIIVGELLLHH